MCKVFPTELENKQIDLRIELCKIFPTKLENKQIDLRNEMCEDVAIPESHCRRHSISSWVMERFKTRREMGRRLYETWALARLNRLIAIRP